MASDRFLSVGSPPSPDPATHFDTLTRKTPKLAGMTFWQENYSFIKEVYDTRYAKMVEWMDNVEMAIQKVCANRIYTSTEFKREKDNFQVI